MSNVIQPKSISSGPDIPSPDTNSATVQMHETTFLQIAQRLGISEESLRQANPNMNPEKLSPGQEIRLPETQVSAKTVQTQESPGSNRTSPGDASAKIAEHKFAGLGRQSQLLASTGGTTGVGTAAPTPQDKVDELADAALDGDLKKVESLIKAGADVNGKDSSIGWTPLTHALTAGNQQIAELLLKNGARVDEPLNDGHTALTTLAKRDSDPASIEFLIKNGANKNHQDISGKTALKYATENGNKDVLEGLLKAGANPDIQDGDKRTALMEAAKKNNKELVDLLVAGKSKPDLTDKDGNTALFEAARHQDKTPDVMKSLLQGGADANKTDPIGRTALWEVAKKGDSESVKALLAANAKVDVKDPVSDTTPLMEAAKQGDPESIKALLGKKANPNFKDGFDRTALMEAAKSGNTETVKLLVAAGAKGNTKDMAGTTALQEAVGHQQTDPAMIEALLRSGADPNVQDKTTGRTPLMEVAAKGDDDSINLLKKGKAKLDVQDKNGRTALMEAAEKGNKRAVAALVGTGDYTNYEPPWADASKKDNQGETALSLAKKALGQPTITGFERSDGKPGITAYEREQYERIVEMLEKAAKKKP